MRFFVFSLVILWVIPWQQSQARGNSWRDIPSDVRRVNALHNELMTEVKRGQKEYAPAGLVGSFRDAIMSAAKDVLKAQGMWYRVKGEEAALARQIEKKLKKRIANVLDDSNLQDRINKAGEFLRDTTTLRMAENEISEWLGFSDVGSLSGQGGLKAGLGSLLGGATKALEEAKKAVSSDGPDMSPLPPELRHQISFKSSGKLRVDSTKTKLVGDMGGAGTSNGVIDAGEWIQLGLEIENTSELPFFSTSAWVKGDDPCLWANDKVEYELAEMPPKGGRTAFAVWVYASRKCDHNKRRKLTIQLKDTHHGNSHSIAGQVRVSRAGKAKLSDVRFDTDIPGYSDGADRKTVEPDQRFELSSSIEIKSGEGVKIKQFYGFADDTEDMLKNVEYRDTDMIKLNDKLFRPGDDLDVLVEEPEDYNDAVKDLDDDSKRWMVTSDRYGTLWVAVEAAVDMRSSNPKPEAPSSKSKKDTLKVKIWTAAEIVSMVRDHISLEARPAKRKLDNSVAATDGYEVVIDEKKFAEIWLAAGISVEAGAPPAMPRPNATIPYLFRLYIPLQAPSNMAPKPVARHIPAPEPEEPSEPMEWPDFRLDLGGGLALIKNLEAENTDFWADEQSQAIQFHGRLTIGSRFVGILDIAQGSGTPAGLTGPTDALVERDIDLKIASFGLGLGYIFGGPNFELQPRIMFESALRELSWEGQSGDPLERKGWSPSAGVTLRYFFNPTFGLHVDASYLMDKVGPTGESGLINESDLMDKSTLRAGGGLTIKF